ncbi:MAG TPA: ParB N-terminal domain-containing protein, partial [Hyphomicrobiales bacterium]|nr:ParB N-terminal domain-containing protein [Hyphomicrobiales bacterium]
AIGLKKPITVTPRMGEDDQERYLLVCGEGRLNAFRNLGEATIPALVISVSDEDARKKYPQGWKAPKPYIRIIPSPEG